MTEKQILLKPETELNSIPVKTEITPMDLLEKAMSKDMDIEKLEKFMELQGKWEKREAEKAFNVDLALAKRDCPVVTKDAVNGQYKSTYNTKGHTVDIITPHIAKFGFSVNWDFEQDKGELTISCVLSHVLGHNKKVSMSAPPDKSGAKNPIQQIKSTKTYLELATFESVLGLAATNATQDDDGNGAGKPVEYITVQQQADITALMDEVKADSKSFFKFLKVDSIGNIPADKVEYALSLLAMKRDKK